mgnify:FL=1
MADKQDNQQQQVTMEEMEFVSNKNSALLLQTPGGAKKLIYVLLVFFLFFIIWAMLTEVDEVVVATGKIEPTEEVLTIQSLEGGIIDELMVNNGDFVVKDQVLARINANISTDKLEEVRKELIVNQIKINRLESIIEDKPLIFTSLIKSQFRNLVDKEISLYNSQKEEHVERINFYLTEIDKEVSKSQFLQQKYQLNAREYEKLAPYKGTNIIPEGRIMEVEKELVATNSEIKDNELQIINLKNQFEEYKLEFKNELKKELNQILGDNESKEHKLSQAEDVVNRTVITSPYNGIVQKVIKTTISSVAKPAETIMEIIPTEQLVANVKIQPKDIGFIKMKQKATVKITSFDYTIYGGIKARVISLSPSSRLDDDAPNPNKNFYYNATLQLAKSSVGKSGLKIIPGMEVSANINTGRKKVIDYLLKPIRRAKMDSLRER